MVTTLVPTYYSEQRATELGLTSGTLQRGDRLLKPCDGGAKPGIWYCYFKNTTGGTLAAATVISLAHVPAGRLIPHMSYIITSAWTTATLDIGWNVHNQDTSTNPTSTVIDSDPDGIIDGLDTGSAVTQFLSASASGSVTAVRTPGISFDGWTELCATIATGTMASNGTIELYLAISRI